MTGPYDQYDDSSEPLLPQALSDDLARLYEAPVAVPAEVDRAVMSLARRRLVRHRRARMVLRSLGVAAAAAIALVILAADPWPQPTVTESPLAARVVAAGPKDVDRNGRVDILDAFALARHIETTHKPQDRWDLNGDGTIDARDVKTVALAAVSLKGGAS